jgi:hypothetical protein
MSATTVALMLFADLSDAELDQLLNMAKSGQQFPGTRGAKFRSPSWMARQCLSGRCRFVQLGRALYTTRRWLREFAEREAERSLAERGVNRPSLARTSSRGDSAADAAFNRLANSRSAKH